MKDFATKEDLFKHLKDNRDFIIAQKKATVKTADAVYLTDLDQSEQQDEVNKATANNAELINKSSLQASLIINTTNILDSHGDVHMPGIWKKAVKEQKNIYLLKEHKMAFESIISDTVTAKTQSISWEKLGYSYNGKTEALVFDCNITKDRNEYMFGQYAKGYVKNHSVGMRYVNLFLCVNSNDRYYAEEKANWDKYITEVVNANEAVEQGYFWAVTEAKIIEGSAVPLGSNQATPVYSIKEPSDDTQTKEDNSHESTIDIGEFKEFIKNKLNN